MSPPSAGPASKSIQFGLRCARSLLDAILIVGTGKPSGVPRPVVNRIRLAPAAASAVVRSIARDLGLDIVQKRITRDEVYIADEAFFTGTAAEVTPIRELDRIELGRGSRGPITEKIQSAFFDIVNGRNPKYAEWLTPVV